MNKDYENWMRARKKKNRILFWRLPLVFLMLVLSITSVPLFIDLLGLCAISYFWIEVGQELKEKKALNNKYRKGLIAFGAMYFIISLVSACFSSFFVWVFVGISTYGFASFEIYKLITMGFGKNKLKAFPSICVGIIGITAGTILYFINQFAFGIAAAGSYFTYVIVDDITRFKVEREDYKREI